MTAPTRHSRSRAALTQRQIDALKMLAKHSGGRPVSLPRNLRITATSLWRLDMIEIWYRQVAGEGHRGPFYALTSGGSALAFVLIERERKIPAPRGSSGAQEVVT